MALTFARIWSKKGVDIVDQFFERARDAELHRYTEHMAAITTQRAWRGFVVRKRMETLHSAATAIQRVFRGSQGRAHVERLILYRSTSRRMKHYFDMAARIQRIWRGYWTRKHVFDYFRRKAYLEGIKDKMDLLREHLAEHVIQQEEQQRSYLASLAAEKADRLAGSRHHMLGTKAVPGVYSGKVGQRRTVAAMVVDQLSASAEPLTEPSNMTTAPGSTSAHQHYIASPSSSSLPQKLPQRHKTLPPLYIQEDSLRHNTALTEWLREHIGVRNYKGPPLHEDRDELVEDKEDIKRVQGPFLLEWQLKKVLRKPLQPSLRVETGFTDTKDAQREERRLRDRLRVADQIFKVVQRVDHPHPQHVLEPMSVTKNPVGRS